MQGGKKRKKKQQKLKKIKDEKRKDDAITENKMNYKRTMDNRDCGKFMRI